MEVLMEFLRSKVKVIFVAVLLVTALFAVIVSVRVSITMAQKKAQMVKGNTQDKFEILKTGPTNINMNKPFDINKNPRIAFFLNGEEKTGVHAYVTNKKVILVPIDIILKKSELEFVLYNSDDIMKADINGKELIIKFRDGSIYLDRVRINFGASPVIAGNHILAPVNIFNYMDGFKFYEYPEQKVVFVNYNPDCEMIEGEEEEILKSSS
jgi:archaellum component FlaG (FlaF/FlaG flagellin family)